MKRTTKIDGIFSTKRFIKAVETFNGYLEKKHFEDYIELLSNPKKLIKVNFLAGLSRGVGFTLGVGFIGTVIAFLILIIGVFVLSMLGYLPVVGDFFKVLSKDISGFVVDYVKERKGG
jgi:hypothetical protein